MDESRIDKVIDDLVADYDRQDGLLDPKQVERLLEKRRLTVDQCASVYSQLAALGISLDDESQVEDDSDLLEPDEPISVDTESTPTWDILGTGRLVDGTLLTAEEEVDLGRTMELGRRAQDEIDKGIPATRTHEDLLERADRARNRMIISNLRLVLHVARSYFGFSDLAPEDLFQEGVTGLMRAVEKYDHTLGYKFSTYATWWIRQSVTRAISNQGSTIRLPVHMHNDVLRLKRALRLLSQIHPERRPHIFELADELTWTVDKVHFVQQVAAMSRVSLDEPVPGHEKLTIIDTLPSRYGHPEETAEKDSLSRAIDGALEQLGERERDIVRLRFGLNESGVPMTLEEIGKLYGVTRERIRQIESKALERLRFKSRVMPDHFFSEYSPDDEVSPRSVTKTEAQQ